MPKARVLKIEMDDYIFSGYGRGSFEFKTYRLIGDDNPNVLRPCYIRPSKDQSCSDEIRMREVRRDVVRYMNLNQDVAVVMDIIKARAEVPELKTQYILTFGPTYATEPKHGCVRAAVLNTICAV